MRSRTPVGWAVLALTVVAAGGRLCAQEVRWRHDYAAARQEAAETGKPLLLDFGSENCIWCQRLDASTFRAPNVVALLNERFVPVKIDGHRDERLTQAMNVTGFPTLVLASAEGRIVGRKDGYIDPAGMAAMLGQALARATPPAPPKVAAAPAPVPAPAPAPRSPAADEFALAREAFDDGRFLLCLDRCERVRSGFAGTAEADAAARLTARITADPGAWRQACDQLTARLDELHPTLEAGLRR